RPDPGLLQDPGRLDRGGDARAVVGGARGPVPGVEVAADDDVLVGLVAPGQVGDHVVKWDGALLEVVADGELQGDRLARLEPAGQLVELLALEADGGDGRDLVPGNPVVTVGED